MNDKHRQRSFMKLIHYFYMGVLAMLLAGCADEDALQQTARSGFLVSLTGDGLQVETKAAPSELPDPIWTEFQLQISRAGTEDVVRTENFQEEKLISLPVGRYDVKAWHGENPVVALDAPYYEGTAEDKEVLADRSTQVSIACKVANALVSLSYQETKAKFSDFYSHYYVSVKVSEESAKIEDPAKSAYFRAGSTFEVYFHGTKVGETEEKSLKLDLKQTTLQAGEQLILTLSPEPAKYDLPLTVEKAEVKTVTVSETLPLEWLPKPKVGGFNADGATAIEQTETAEAVPAVLNYTASRAVQEVELTLDVQDPDYASLNGTYLFSTLTEEDRTKLTEVGIALPVLDDASTAGSIDLTALTGKLKVASGNATNHTVKLRVKANDRWSSEEDAPAVYTIRTVAPKVILTADEKDIWARSLTISGSTVETGDAATVQANLTYQYQDVDGTWKDCTEAGLAELSRLPDTPQMQVRALYRGVVECEPTTFTLETPAQLPNSDMEEWHYETYSGDRYTFNPWMSGDTGFWDTSNDFTTRHRYNTTSIYNYNGFHSVSYVQGRGGNGLAAELRSTANGRGNTEFIGHTEQNYNKVAGELFTGTANVTLGTSGLFGDADGSKDTYERQKNASFSSRPTALQFYYKYVPYGSDTWKVHVELLDESGNVIIQNESTSSTAQGDWSSEPFTLTLPYEEGMSYAKCHYIFVQFLSTTQAGANMPYNNDSGNTQIFYVLENGALVEHSYDKAYVGSVLTIDDISLVYDK